MPKQLREWPAYNELKKEIEDFQGVLPLLLELGKPSIMPRHWQQVMDITGGRLHPLCQPRDLAIAYDIKGRQRLGKIRGVNEVIVRIRQHKD